MPEWEDSGELISRSRCCFQDCKFAISNPTQKLVRHRNITVSEGFQWSPSENYSYGIVENILWFRLSSCKRPKAGPGMMMKNHSKLKDFSIISNFILMKLHIKMLSHKILKLQLQKKYEHACMALKSYCKY